MLEINEDVAHAVASVWFQSVHSWNIQYFYKGWIFEGRRILFTREAFEWSEGGS